MSGTDDLTAELMRRHGYDPSLPPRGVASGTPPAGLRNWVCEIEGTEIDGHSDPDRSGLCVFCGAEIEDVPWSANPEGARDGT